MFRGRHNVRMEERGRIAIPTKLREILNVLYEGKIVLSCGFFQKAPHLLLVPLKEWEDFEARYPSAGLLDGDEDGFLARIRTIGSCEETRVDEHGRIILPEFMRAYARLDREVAFVGMGRHLAVFSPKVLDETLRSAERGLDRVRERVTRTTTTDRNGPPTSP